MPFPAWDAFDSDPRISLQMVRVYRHLRDVLDFLEPREYSLEQVAHWTSIDVGDVSRNLRKLVAWGYVLEHPRVAGGKARRYSLAWSVRVDLRAPKAS
jgi:hypothetical protein